MSVDCHLASPAKERGQLAQRPDAILSATGVEPVQVERLPTSSARSQHIEREVVADVGEPRARGTQHLGCLVECLPMRLGGPQEVGGEHTHEKYSRTPIRSSFMFCCRSSPLLNTTGSKP